MRRTRRIIIIEERGEMLALLRRQNPGCALQRPPRNRSRGEREPRVGRERDLAIATPPEGMIRGVVRDFVL